MQGTGVSYTVGQGISWLPHPLVEAAYGEEILNSTQTEDTVIVPFDWNGKFCGWENPELKVVWICSWDPNRINLLDGMENGTKSIPEPIQGSTTTCPERFTLLEDGVTCLPKECDEGFHFDQYYYCVADEVIVPEPTNEEFNKYQGIIEYYENNPPKTWSELDESWKLEHLENCWYGLNQSRGIQTEDSFVTSSWTETPSVAKATDASIIDRAIDECNAETKMLKILGDDRQPGDVRSAQGWFGIVEAPHGERVKDVPVWSQERVNQEANKDRNNNISYCDSVQHLGLATLRYLDCPDPTRPDPQAPVVIYDSFVTTQNDIEDRWTQYKLDGGAVETDRIKAEALAKHQAELYKKERVTNPNYSITEEIYKIERNGWSLFPESERPSECFDNEMNKLEYYQRCGQ